MAFSLPNSNPNSSPPGNYLLGISAKLAATASAVGTTANAVVNHERERKNSFLMRVKSQEEVANSKMSRKQYLESSLLTNQPAKEAEEFLRSHKLLSSDEYIEDTHTGLFNLALPCHIPFVSESKRGIRRKNRPGSTIGPGSSSQYNKNLGKSSESKENKITSSSGKEEVTTSLFNEQASQLSKKEKDVMHNFCDVNHLSDQISHQIVLEKPHYYSNSLFASASSSQTAMQGSTEVFSVKSPTPAWALSGLFIASCGLVYVVIFPLLEKGAASFREFLNHSTSKNALDYSNITGIPGTEISYNKNFANPVETITEYNKNNVTFNQAKLLLEKSALFSVDEIELLLKKD